MIYLDNAATSFPKPQSSTAAMYEAARTCAGYGRSSHAAAIHAAEIVYQCREELAQMFGLDSPNHAAFTMNATMALNYAIHAAVPERSTVCISGYEHNSVVRPLVERNCRIHIVRQRTGQTILEAWEEHIRKRPVCVVVNHASNVFGYLQPIEEIGNLCSIYHVPLIVDASQSAGVCDVKMARIPSCAAICTAGHKGLLGPQGTGVLLYSASLPRRALIAGGTGSRSADLHQPKDIPDLFESGTHNLPGIAGLLESVRILRKTGFESIRKKEELLLNQMEKGLRSIKQIRIAGRPAEYGKLAVISVIPQCCSCEELGERLAEKGVYVRTGLHCAPLAHRSEGTIETGTVRFSIGWKNTEQDIDTALMVIESIMNSF